MDLNTPQGEVVLTHNNTKDRQPESTGFHRHTFNLYPFTNDACTVDMHLRGSEREGVWQCDCGERMCRDCF